MTRDILIGIDAGTSVIKAVAFDSFGRQLAIVSRQNRYTTRPGGVVEQNMVRTWTDTAAVVKELAGSLENLGERVLALAVTGQGDGTWLIDEAGVPVHDGWLWLDSRAAAEARKIEASQAIDTIYRTTATGVNLCQMRTHLRWMKRHDRGLLERAASALHCKDWLYYRLTGVRATDPTEGLFTFGDFRTRTYSDAVLEALGLGDIKRLLPPIVDGAVHTDGLSVEAARATGLPEGLPVALGCVDVMCCAIGTGLHDPVARPGLTIFGSTGMHMRFVPDARAVSLNAARSGYTMAFPGGAYAQMQTNMAATLNIDWMLGIAAQVLDTCGHACDPADLLKGLDERVLAARPGAAVYHPYVSAAGERGPFAEPDARASFTGIDNGTGWFDLVRGVYDGLVLAARDCYAAMGPTPGEIRLAGGAARSVALRTLTAAALRTPVRTVTQPEAGAAGAAMMAGVALGLFPDIATATEVWVTPLLDAPEAPDERLAEICDAQFDAYLSTRQALEPAWAAQAVMRQAIG